jgi:2'-5' RNA ligase
VRLFVAANFPSEVRERLWRAAEPLRARDFPVRWVEPSGLHVTLKFLGEVEPSRERELIDAVESSITGARRFSMGLAGFGAFPRPDRPRVIWAGCEAAPPLELLQDRLERAMAALGFPVEGRPFRPHVTLGRVRQGARPRALEGVEALLETLAFQDAVEVQSLDLMRSELRRDGARYSLVHAATLGERR